MAGKQGLEELNQQKQALVLESELNRLAFWTEVENLRAAASRFDGLRAPLRRYGPWLLPLITAGGLFAGRSVRKSSSTLGSLLKLIRWLSPLVVLWRNRAAANRK